MTSQLFIELFNRDLEKLKEEISLYRNENDLWLLKDGIKNSAGTLTLHIIGNLFHFVGAVLGKTGYVRKRDKEFSDRNISRKKMLYDINNVILIIKDSLSKFSDEDLQKEFPIEFLGKRKTIQVLIILTAHLNYHLGQINYHRRIITEC